MDDTTTLTVRTKKQIKEQAQQFFDWLGISMSAAVNLFLSDVAHNQRLSFQIEHIVLTPVSYDDLPEEVKTSYQETKALKDDEMVYFTAADYADR